VSLSAHPRTVYPRSSVRGSPSCMAPLYLCVPAPLIESASIEKHGARMGRRCWAPAAKGVLQGASVAQAGMTRTEGRRVASRGRMEAARLNCQGVPACLIDLCLPGSPARSRRPDLESVSDKTQHEKKRRLCCLSSQQPASHPPVSQPRCLGRPRFERPGKRSLVIWT